MVTPALFRKYPTARELARARPASLEKDIRSTGFFRAKTRSLLGMSKALVERHGAEVPKALEALVELPGVGLKTANVVIGNAFGGQALAVDTHVFRVSQRLGLARGDDPDEIHDQLVAVLPRESLTHATHLMITHGRRTCLARKPACPACPVRALTLTSYYEMAFETKEQAIFTKEQLLEPPPPLGSAMARREAR